jgi:hypothetical protein
VRPVSKKRARKAAERRKVVAEVIYRDGSCQAAGRAPGPCGGPLDVHEVIPRSAWADGYLEPSNCMVVCRSHHSWIDDHPKTAALIGLHGYSWDRPA